MNDGVRIDRNALAGMIAGADGRRVLKGAADQIRDRARTNAEAIDPSAVGAIESIVAGDSQGPYADVGYNKKHGGFTLWWAEVGTRNQPSQPHLRPAMVPGMLGNGVSDATSGLREYTTRDGRTRTATDRQIANWTRGRTS